MAELQDTDLMLVNRGGKSYKATGAEIKDSLFPPIVTQPQIISPADGAGVLIGAQSDEIVGVEQASTQIFGWPLGGSGELPNDLADVYERGTPLEIGQSAAGFPRVIIVPRGDEDGKVFSANGTAGWTLTNPAYGGYYNADGTVRPYANAAYQQTDWTTSLRWYDGDGVSQIPLYKVDRNSAYIVMGGSGRGVNTNVISNPPNTIKLTLASDKDLSGDPSFKENDEVQQNSGHTPRTSAITAVNDLSSPFSWTGTTYSSASAHPPQKLLDGDLTTSWRFTSSNYQATNIELAGDAITNSAGQMVSVYVAKAGHTVTETVRMNLTFYNGSTVLENWTQDSLSDSNADAWLDLREIPAGATKFRIDDQGGTSTSGGANLAALKFGDQFVISTSGGANSGSGTIDSYSVTFADDTDLENFRVNDVVKSDDQASLGIISSINKSANTMYLKAQNYSDTSTAREAEKLFDGDEGRYASQGFSSPAFQTVTETPIIITKTNSGFRYKTNNFGTAGLSRKLRLTRASDGDVVTVDSGNANDANGDPWRSIIPDSHKNTVLSKVEWARESSYENVSAIYVDDVRLEDSNAVLDFQVGQTIIGPITEPAKGIVLNVDAGSNELILRDASEQLPDRWIANQGKIVIGELYPSAIAAPDPDELTLIATEFLSAPAGALSHQSSTWQVTGFDDISYSNVLASSTDDLSNLTSWKVTPSLNESTQYRARVRYKAMEGQESGWSEDQVFRTGTGLGSPTITDFGIYGIDDGAGGWITTISDPAVLTSTFKAKPYFNNDQNDSAKVGNSGNNGIYCNSASNYLTFLITGGAGAQVELIMGGANNTMTNFGCDIAGDCLEDGDLFIMTDTDKWTLPKYSLILTATKDDAVVTIKPKAPPTPVPGSVLKPNGSEATILLYYISNL